MLGSANPCRAPDRMTDRWTRLTFIFAALACVALASPTRGEAGSGRDSRSATTTGAAAAGSQEPCVAVTIGHDSAGFLDCLNEELRRATKQSQAVPPSPTYGPNSPPT